MTSALDRLRKTLPLATAPPWAASTTLENEPIVTTAPTFGRHVVLGKPPTWPDADLIALSRNLAPAMLAVIDAAKALDARFFDGQEDWSRVGLPGEVDDVHDALARLDAIE